MQHTPFTIHTIGAFASFDALHSTRWAEREKWQKKMDRKERKRDRERAIQCYNHIENVTHSAHHSHWYIRHPWICVLIENGSKLLNEKFSVQMFQSRLKINIRLYLKYFLTLSLSSSLLCQEMSADVKHKTVVKSLGEIFGTPRPSHFSRWKRNNSEMRSRIIGRKQVFSEIVSKEMLCNLICCVCVCVCRTLRASEHRVFCCVF